MVPWNHLPGFSPKNQLDPLDQPAPFPPSWNVLPKFQHLQEATHPQQKVHRRQPSEQAFHWGPHHGVIQVPNSLTPDPKKPTKTESNYWPCPPLLAIAETEWRKQKASQREAEEEEEETMIPERRWRLSLECQRQELSKVTSNFGKMNLERRDGNTIASLEENLLPAWPDTLSSLLIPRTSKSSLHLQQKPITVHRPQPIRSETRSKGLYIYPYEMLVVTNKGWTKLSPVWIWWGCQQRTQGYFSCLLKSLTSWLCGGKASSRKRLLF